MTAATMSLNSFTLTGAICCWWTGISKIEANSRYNIKQTPWTSDALIFVFLFES